MNVKSGCPVGTIRDRTNNVCIPKKENLKPMVCWPGGKSRVSKEIIGKIPDHKVYVEPFIGGGSVFFEKSLATNGNVINDKNKNLVNFYRSMTTISHKELVGCRHPSRKKWEKLRNKRDRGEILTMCEFHQLVKGSYGCMTNSWGYKENKIGKQLGQGTDKNLLHYQDKLKNTKITKLDYAIVTKKHDGGNTFFYVDPPYHKAIDYNQSIIHPKEVADTFKDVKGKVMISYNDHPDVRKAFPKKDGWKYSYLHIPYTLQHSNADSYRESKKELLIMNY